VAIQVKHIVAKVQHLPMPSAAALQVLQLCTDETTGAREVADAISGDQSLTAEVLRVANSSYFNYPREIANIQRAIVVLGFNLVKDIAVSFAFRNFYRTLSKGLVVNLKYTWEHALLTGAIARALAKPFALNFPDTLFVGGLLHDIGKLVLAITLKNDYGLLLKQINGAGHHLFMIEQDTWGFHHGDAGGILIERWHLPEILVKMVSYHHNPADFSGKVEEFRSIQVVYLSNLLAHCYHRSSITLEEIASLDNNFQQYFPFTEGEFHSLTKTVDAALRKDRQLAALGLIIPELV
jgi:HD-like signal output (HDOD) protein